MRVHSPLVRVMLLSLRILAGVTVEAFAACTDWERNVLLPKTYKCSPQAIEAIISASISWNKLGPPCAPLWAYETCPILPHHASGSRAEDWRGLLACCLVAVLEQVV